MEPWQPKRITDVTILTLLSSTIPFAKVTSHHLLHMVFTCRNWFDIRQRTCNSYKDFLHRSVLLTRKLLSQGFIETRLRSTLKRFLVDTIIWHSLIVSQWPPWLMRYVGHDIVVMSTFYSLIRHRRYHDGCRMRSRKFVPFRSAWSHLWFSWRFMLSCHLCLHVLCDSLVFWILSFDCSVCLIAWYLYFLLFETQQQWLTV